ncbi:MAG: autotransporter-associated beta strand repeat-containing protein, partial [Verrucomicrobiota bacterium]
DKTGTLTFGSGGGFNYGTTNPGTSTISGKLDLGVATRTFAVADSTNTTNELNITATISSSAGAYGISKTGLGTMTLSGANTYTGATSVDNGILSVSSLNKVVGGSASSSLGAPVNSSNGTITLGSGTTTGQLTYTGASGETTDRIVSLTGTTGGAVLDQSGASGLLKLTSNFTATGSGAKTLTLQGSTAGTGEIAGAIVNFNSGNATSVTKSGTGTWTLSGNNTYTGTTTISAGTLQFSKQTSLYTGNNTLWTAAKISVGNGTLALNVGGAGEFTTGNVTTLLANLGGANGTGTTGFAAGSKIAFDTTGGNFTAANNIADSTGSGGGAIGLTKLGANTLALTGTNTYTGATTVSSGTLLINGSTSTSSAINVSSGATLGGNGTIGGAVTVSNGGFLAPGNSPGNITVANSVTIADGGAVSMELNGVDVGTLYDRITMTGGGSVFTLAGTNNLVLSLGYTPDANTLFFLVDNQGSSAISGIFEKLNGVVTDLSQGAMFTVSSQQFQISYTGNVGTNSFAGSGNDLVLQAVPEPATWALLAFSLTTVMVLRRRRS